MSKEFTKVYLKDYLSPNGSKSYEQLVGDLEYKTSALKQSVTLVSVPGFTLLTCFPMNFDIPSDQDYRFLTSTHEYLTAFDALNCKNGKVLLP